MIEKFRNTSPNSLLNIFFDAIIDLNEYPKYIIELTSKLDNRVHSQIEVEQKLKPIVDKIREYMNTDIDDSQLEKCIEKLFTETSLLQTKKNVSISEYNNSIFTRFFKIGFIIKYCGKPLEELSMGERAIILLKILLALGDKPLLIDQPEEHLDNRFIFNDLIPAFRDAKKKRQIFIATHNANLVVNTDADQVIIAENNSGILSYKDGTLEDLTIRDTIKTILEGGDDAFKKREQRYGYIF